MSPIHSTTIARRLLVAAALTLAAMAAGAQALEVKTAKDEGGWKLLVDGKDFQVKGVVWAYTPIGENYAYDLWSKPEDYIRKTIDTDMPLLKKMGCTAIRCFSIIPPEWVEYIYTRYGIATIVNDMFGRYGVEAAGVWHAKTDYSDPTTRKVLLAQAKATVQRFKDTKGVLFFMFGNESNYGLDWSSDQIENLPAGQRQDAKARFLYSLFDEAIKQGKELDPNHPFGIVNGDLGYLDQIKELCPDLDILGVNTYRGRKAYNAFYASVDQSLDKPLVFTEFGADAYNIKTGQEDQIHQAEFVRDQWEELYGQSYGKGKSQNVIGGFVFEWIDEWWKHGMDSGLDVHDTEGTWTNGAYDFDAVAGKNNMNEEWFGIVGQSELTADGIHRRLPRAAYYLLQRIWALDLYKSTPQQIKDAFSAATIADAQALADPQVLRNALDERKPLSMAATFEARSFATATGSGFDALNDPDGLKTKAVYRNLETASVDLSLRPSENLSAGIETKFSTQSQAFDATSGKPLSWFTLSPAFTWEQSGGLPVQLYSAWASYDAPALKADFYYRTGHPDWYLSGDFFGFLHESFDRYTMDLNKQSAPYGLELGFKDALQGLTVYGGPEIYPGAMPSVMAKYYRQFGRFAFGLLHDEELCYPDGTTVSPIQKTVWTSTPLTRRSSLYAQADFLPAVEAQLGLMLGSPEKIGQSFTNAVAVAPGAGSSGSGYEVYLNRQASLLDALGAKLRLSTALVPYVVQAYAQGVYMGPLADGEPFVARSGSQIADPGLGNRMDAEVGLTAVYGDFSLSPKFLYRHPIYDALPSIPAIGISPRTYTDLFYVSKNREAVEGELVACYDPEGSTYFFDWNNDDREGAAFAASLSFLYNFYLGPTDRLNFVADNQGTVYSFNAGLPSVAGTWSLQGRAVVRPLPNLRLIATAVAGEAQSEGDPTQPLANFVGGSLRVALGRLSLNGELYRNYWGSEYWYRQFQEIFPVRAKLGFAYGLKDLSFMGETDRIGLDLLYRSDTSMLAASGSDDQKECIEAQVYVNFSL